jgi:uncharacterized protein involved in type VI secretion and phage assembly
MARTIYELGDSDDMPKHPKISITSGTVVNNCDLIGHGKVMVRVAGTGQEVWARLVAPGAGSGTGFLYVPRIGDEVLVALADDEPSNAFLIGGVWSTIDRPPTNPLEMMSKRVIRTGLTAALGHELTFDDVRQSVTLTTSTQQKITVDPLKIELTNLAGTVTITLDNKTQSISMTAVKAISLTAAEITLKAGKVSIQGAAQAELTSAGICDVRAPLVKINS